MKKTWIFFKLRMLQLKSDKTALFFSYIFPVLLLVGIGYANQETKPEITLHYVDQAQTAASEAFLKGLSQHPLIKLFPYAGDVKDVDDLVKSDDIKHYVLIKPSTDEVISYEFKNNSLSENLIENVALNGIILNIINPALIPVTSVNLQSEKQTSYLTILLPGLVGMTLLLVGLNGFGNLLIEEEHRGLYKNIKTIDISPIPFLAGLFFSRLLICYSVAIVLFLIGIFVFKISYQVNYPLLILVVTLGSIAFLGLGLMLSSISPSVTAFNGIVNFVQLPFVVLGGVFFSIAAFPQWVQYISQVIPLTSMNTAMQKILFQSTDLHSISTISGELTVLVVWCLGTILISYMKFRW